MERYSKAISVGMILTISAFQITIYAETIRVTKPEEVKTSEATYMLFKSHFSDEWAKKYSQEKRTSFPLDPLPVFRLPGHCQSDVLLILPFERLIYRTNNKETARRSTTITKNGSRVLIYGIDFENRKFVLLFDGLLTDFHGAIVSSKSCPDLLVTVSNDRFKGRSLGVGYTRLTFNDGKKLYELSPQEITP